MSARRAFRTISAAALLAIVAFGLRIAVLERVFPVRPLGDEVYYVLVAANLADGLGHVYGGDAFALRPPAHAWLLSLVTDPDAVLAVPGAGDGPAVRVEALRPLLLLEVLLGTALCLATALLGAVLFDARTGLLAGAVAAVYPTFVAYSHLLWSETLFALLVTTALACAVRAEERRSAALAALAGAVFGLAALTREIAAPVAAAVAVWAWWTAPRGGRPAALARGALLVACAAAVILPWTARNYARFGRIVPVSTVGWIAVGEGNSLEGAKWLRPSAPGRTAFRREVLAQPGELARADFARRRTLARIGENPPAWLARKLAHNLPLLASPDAFHLYKLRNGSYGEVPPSTARAVTLATVGSYLAVVLLAVPGVLGARERGRRRLAGLVLLVVCAVHVAANANSRFRMPWMPLLLVYAAHAARGGRAALADLRGWERALGAALAVALVAICASYFFISLR